MRYRPCLARRPKVLYTGRGVSSLRIRFASPLWAVFFLLFTEAGAAANVAESLGLGARAIALGNAYTAIADDFTSVYYNPGGLSSAPESKLTIGALWARPYFYYQEHGGARVRPHLYSTGSLYIGVSSNLGHLTGYSQLRKWTLGLSFYAPVERALLADIPNESTEKRFIFYLDQTQVMAISAGLSFQILHSLSIGVAGNFLADLRAPNEADVEADIRTVIPYLAGASDLAKKVRPRIMRDAELKAAPILGVRFTPVGWFSCGLTFRGKFYAETVGTQDILIRFKDFSERSEGMLQSAVLADIHYVHYWTPNELAFGLAMRPRRDILVAADLTWSDWSDYIDPQWRVPERKFSDTFTPRIGLEYVRPPGFAVRAGYGFQPSPVPEQTGAANYLDNDKHVFSFGMGYTFARSPLAIWKKPLTVNCYVQYQQLVKRHYHKTVEASSENTLSFGGHLVHAGVDIVLHF
jgi:long-chain fatty acid transport protein